MLDEGRAFHWPRLAVSAGTSSGLPWPVIVAVVPGVHRPSSSNACVLSAYVRKIVSDDGLRTKMGRNARASAERRDWGTSTRTLRGYYEQALEQR